MILISCNRRNEIEGTWYVAYSIYDGKPERLHETHLLDFEGKNLYTVTIRDLSSGRNDKVIIDTSFYSMSDSILELYDERLTFHYAGDSLLLDLNGQEGQLVLRRLSPTLKNPEIGTNCFHGAYIIYSDNYHDSIDFINDSLLIYTGKYDPNFPASKWQIVDYKGFKFLNEHDDLKPVMLIKSCDEKGIHLLYPSIKTYKIKMIPNEMDINKAVFLGTWNQGNYSGLNSPPPPPNMNQVDMPFRVEITKDEIISRIRGRIKTYKWNLTSDGKRIYFIDEILDNHGSWKVLNVNDSTMTLQLATNTGTPEIIKLKKEKNGR